MVKSEPAYIKVKPKKEGTPGKEHLDGLITELLDGRRHPPGSYKSILQTENSEAVFEYTPPPYDRSNPIDKDMALLVVLKYIRGEGFYADEIPLKKMVKDFDIEGI